MSVERLRRHPGYLVLQLSKQARRISTTVSKDGLRAPHVSVLARLAESGPCSQKEISDALLIDASDLVTLLDDLEQAGLASRHRDEHDRRRYAVEITELEGPKVEVKLIGKGQPVHRAIKEIHKGEWFVYTGDDDKHECSWFVIITELDEK